MEQGLNSLGRQDLEALQRDGVLKKEKFFPSRTIGQIADTAIRLRAHGLTHRSPARKWIIVSPLNTLPRILSPGTRADVRLLSEVALACGFRRFASLYLDEPVMLSHVMSMEHPVSTTPITPWHVDANPREMMPPNYFTMKFFIYLNDVDSNNGAFAYLRGSHRLVLAIREGIHSRSIPYCKTYGIEDLKAACGDPVVRNQILNRLSQQDIDDFFAATEPIARTGDTDVYDLTGAAGTLVVFDDRGLHRGGIPRTAPRSVLRYNYICTRYWGEHLSWPRYTLNMAARALLPGTVAAHWSSLELTHHA